VDCLETLEEIGMAGKETFLEAGGERYHLIPCLNDREDWVEVMAGMIASRHVDAAGGVTAPELRL
jgi:ferrochelatase